MNVIVILCDTLRRDHVSAYTGGKPLNQCWSKEAPDWSVQTPNIDRLAERGTVFDNCWHGSSPCMPARRDIHTGRYEFLERGWGPLEDDVFDLPRQVSGPPNRSIQWSMKEGYPISYLITDHFHLWEQGAGNYHMGYSGFDFVRGSEADAWYTAPAPFDCPPVEKYNKNERHYRNVHYIRQTDDDYFCAQVAERTCEWLKRNREHKNFFLHLDIFDPHEPWDPPEDILKMFDPKGYDVKGLGSGAPYAKWEDRLTEEQFRNVRARYAGKVVFLDRQLGKVFDTLDKLGMWDDTIVILTTDHGTFNGDHGRTGKLQTHEFDAKSHIPFIVAHPGGKGDHRSQLVQLVDIYPTVLDAVGRPFPEYPDEVPGYDTMGRWFDRKREQSLHGVSLLPVLQDPDAQTRDYAVCGQFGKSITITDGTWSLHQAPVKENKPLYWHGTPFAKFQPVKLGPFDGEKREAIDFPDWGTPTWLSHLEQDPNELENLAGTHKEKLIEMQNALRIKLKELRAPDWQAQRLGLLGK